MRKLIAVFLLSMQFFYLSAVNLPLKGVMLDSVFCGGEVTTLSGLFNVVRENTMESLYTLAQLSGINVGNETFPKTENKKERKDKDTQKQPSGIIPQNGFNLDTKNLLKLFTSHPEQPYSKVYTHNSVLVNFLNFLLFLCIFLHLFRLKLFYIHARSSIDHLINNAIVVLKNPALKNLKQVFLLIYKGGFLCCL